MAKQIVPAYTFDASAKTIDLDDFGTVRLDRLLVVSDATLATLLYNFADPTVTATVTGNTITLSAVPGGAADTDDLVIVYDAVDGDPTYDEVPVVGPLTDVELRATPVPIADGGGSVTVDGTVAATQSGPWNVGTVSTVTNVVHVDDNASTLSVDDGGGSLTVDGTVAATQSGTWTVQPGNTANSTAWKVDGSAATQPVSHTGLTALGATTDNKTTATDTTAVTAISLLKEISYQLQQQQPTIIDKFASEVGTITTGGTTQTVDIDTSAFAAVYEIEIVNADGTDDFKVTVGTTAASPATPTTSNSQFIPGSGVPAAITLPNNFVGTSLRVKILCATTGAQYAVVVRGH